MELKPYEFPELIRHGRVQTVDMVMETFPDKRNRTIRIWTPEDYDGVKRFPVIYMHDGQGLFKDDSPMAKLEMDNAVTSLKAEGISAIVVGIDTAATRGSELTPAPNRGEVGATVNGFKIPVIPEPSTTDQYADFILTQVMPFVNEHFMTLTGPENTCIGGVSAGGTCSYYMMLRNPEVFGKVIACSPGFPMFSLKGLLKELDETDFSKLADHRIAFYNGDQTIDVTSVDHVLAVYRKLKKKGMDEKHLMFLLDTRQSHRNEAWAKYMPELIRFLFTGTEQ